MVRLKDVFWKYIDKDRDNDFFYHYLVDLLNYKNIIHSLDKKGQPRTNEGYNLLADWEKEDLKSIQDKLWDGLQRYCNELPDVAGARVHEWYAGWNGYSELRFNKYDENTLMKLHCDHIHSMFDGQRKGIPALSLLGCLNDDYEGGELIFWDDTEIKLKGGSLLIFPSNFMYPHEVKPVTKGSRYSYVSWAW